MRYRLLFLPLLILISACQTIPYQHIKPLSRGNRNW